jgi:hypothetical protein
LNPEVQLVNGQNGGEKTRQRKEPARLKATATEAMTLFSGG